MTGLDIGGRQGRMREGRRALMLMTMMKRMTMMMMMKAGLEEFPGGAPLSLTLLCGSNLVRYTKTHSHTHTHT